MTEGSSADRDLSLVEIDTTVPHAARVYDYMLGGVTNFAVDREAAEQAAALVGGMDLVRAEVRANRDFLARAVRYLINEAGIRQFLDIGTGIPNDDHVHDIALQEAPESRIVYVDKDPVVLAHAHELLGDSTGSVLFIQDDVRHPERILERAGRVLDLSRPVGVMMVGLLHHIRDEDRPGLLVGRIMDGVAGGSHLVVSHLASDIHAGGYAEAGEHLDEAMDEPMLFRTREEVADFFAGLEMIEPGVVPVDEWRPPEHQEPSLEGWTNPLHVGIGRKRGA